jgi:predicted AAA+ superfamily ATPase
MTALPRVIRPHEGHFFLLGPRGTGKSTWLRTIFPNALVVDLLDPRQEREYLARPERLGELVRAHEGLKVLIVDEVQKVPALLDVVHQLIEERGARPGRSRGRDRLRFILTGSSARRLKRSGVDLLAGRATMLSMHPFMAKEIGAGFRMDRALRTGMLPVVWDAKEPEEALKAYAGLYVREEVQFEGLARRMSSFARFLEAISFSHGAQINLSDISRECETPRATVDGYLATLEDLLLAFRLPVFTRRAKRQVASHPKFYWFDVGLFRAFRPKGPLDRPAEISGAALEGLVAQHLRAWIAYSRRDAALSFWRTRAGNEVDFVVYGKDAFTAIEVTSASRVRPKDLSGLRSFGEDYPEAKRVLLYLGKDRLKLEGILVIPVEEYLCSIAPDRNLPE